MSLAENLLNSLPEDGSTSRLAGVDEEPHIIVDENRRINVPEELKLIAVTGDKKVETVTFDCVRYWDGNDLSTFTIYLNYTLPDGRDGTHSPNDIKVFDDHYSFTWTLDAPVTDSDGNIQISVMARLIDSNAKVLKQWSSFPNNELTIVKGQYISYLEGEDKEEQDFLSQILSEIRNKPSIVGAELVEVTEDMPTIISFTIDGKQYNADSGMTWSEWVNSDYNTDGFKVNANVVYNKNDGFLYDNDPSTSDQFYDVVANTVIPNGSKYYSTMQFTIDDIPYKANFYMKWGQWVASNYNTGGFYIFAPSVMVGDDSFLYLDDSDVHIEDTIQANVEYSTRSASVISFTIDGVTYQTESGMTWSEWVDSDYNTDGYVINDSVGVIQPANDDSVAVKDQTDFVYYDDIITTDGEYRLGFY